MADAYSVIEDGLRAGLAEVVDQLGPEQELLDRYGWEGLFEIGKRAAQMITAPILWDQRLGPMMDTAQVCELLGVSRQAVAKKVAAGQLLALPAGRTRRFPTWQFHLGAHTEVRVEVAAILTAFRDTYPDLRPYQVAAWAMTPQPELGGDTPARWLEAARPPESLVTAARRAGAALAQ